MDQPIDQPSQQPEWFENLIANYDTQTPQAGEILQGTVIRSVQEGIFLDLGLKREILVPARDLEFINKEDLDSLEPGSQVPVMVVSAASENKDIEVSISRALEQQVWEKAQKDLEAGTILSLEVAEHNRGGLIVRYENLRGFVPYSLVPDLQGVRNPKRAESIKNGLIGKPLDVKITEVDPERRRLILSAESAQLELRQKMLESFKKGQIVTGKIVKVVDFGAFVDLGGIDGLIHVSQLSWKKVKHPSEAVKVGEEVEVKIIEIDRDRQRIGLSRKALLPGPWQTITDELKPGDYVEGIVTRIVNFGAFVKIPQGVEGLIHTSQIGYFSHQDPQNAIKPGDKVLLKVLDIKPERKRVALSMRQVPMEKQIAWAMEKLEEFGSQQEKLTEADTPPPSTEAAIEPLAEAAESDQSQASDSIPSEAIEPEPPQSAFEQESLPEDFAAEMPESISQDSTSPEADQDSAPEELSPESEETINETAVG